MEAVLDFFKGSTAVAGFAVPNWAFVAAGAVVLVLIVVIIAVAASGSKKKAAKKPAAKAEPVKQEPVQEKAEEKPAEKEPATIVEQKPVEQEPREKQPEIEEEKPAEKPAEKIEKAEKAPAPKKEKPAPAKEAKAAPAKEAKPAPVEEKPAPAKEGPVVKRNDEQPVAAGRRSRVAGKTDDEVFGKGVVEEPVAPVAKEKKAAEKKPAEKPAEKAPKAEKEPVAEPVEQEVAATTADGKKGAVGKFEICNSSVGGFRFLLIANNGQLLSESRDYKTFDGCREAIGKFVSAVKAGDFRVRGDKFGNFKFNLKSPTSNNIVFVGESYDAKKKCENAVESVKRFAETAKIVDITEADFVATSAAVEIPADVKSDVASGKGAVGKWEIVLAEDGPNAPYVFLLYANNGQLLYESRDYKTFDNCRSGLDTFVKTVRDGEFIVDSDKFGRYRFILRKAGNQVEYIGQNYNDKPSAARSAISVYKFALLTPVELD